MSVRNWSGRGGGLRGSFLLIGRLLAAAARLQRRRLKLGLLGLDASGLGFLLNNPGPHRTEDHLQTPLGVTQPLSPRALPLLALSLAVLLGQGVALLPIQPAVEAGRGILAVQPVGE